MKSMGRKCKEFIREYEDDDDVLVLMMIMMTTRALVVIDGVLALTDRTSPDTRRLTEPRK